MDKFISVGYENSVNSERVVAIVNADSRASKRLISESTSNNNIVDATEGTKTASLIVMEGGQVVLSPIKSETIRRRLNNKKTK